MVAFLPVAGAGKVAGARVHPVVVFNACDSFVRRAEAQDRVIGTLLGSVGVDGVVDVRNCYAVPHNEQNDTVYVDVEFHRAMIELHQKVNPSEKIVGWYSTGDGVVPTDALIHEFYSHECQNPVHVTLDVGFNDRAKLMRAWTGSSIAIGAQAKSAADAAGDKAAAAAAIAEKKETAPGEDGDDAAATGPGDDASASAAKPPAAIHFQEINLTNVFDEAERVGVARLCAPSSDASTSDDVSGADGLQKTVAKLSGMLDDAAKHVAAVCDGKAPADAEIGRHLSDALSAVPRLTKEQFEKLFGDSVADVLLTRYLANITKMQLMLAEKLQTTSLLV